MIDSGAHFSPCGLYRYDLWRKWDMFGNGSIAFIGLNPSTADAIQDDPTVRRCINYAKGWGYSGMVMLNLFAYRATLPSDMKKVEDPIGPETDACIRKYAETHRLVAVWGVHGCYRDRDKQVLSYLNDLYCLGLTKEGHPKHPLYLKKDLKLIQLNTRTK